jgi:hypothetical protein
VSHWFSGWKLWPDAPKGPVDHAYRQRAWIRPYSPGLPRLMVSAFGVLVFMLPMYSAIIILLSPGTPLVQRLLITASFALIAFGVATFVGRIYATGVYVNDFGLRLITVRGMLSLPWSEVVDVSSAAGRVKVLGLPLLRFNGELVVVTTRDGGPMSAPLTSRGLDFFGRREGYATAALAIERWWRDTRGDA